MTRIEVLRRLAAHEIGVEEAEGLLMHDGPPSMPRPVPPPNKRRSGCGCGCLTVLVVVLSLLVLSVLAVLSFRLRSVKRSSMIIERVEPYP